MQTVPPPSVFETLSVVPAINACGIYTDLGGSILSPEIMAAWSELNQSWVQMTELLDRTGERVASLIKVPAARITPGASAAIALGVAACMTGSDSANWDRLPDTRGLKGEILFQKHQLDRYKYAVCARLPGAKLVSIGSSTKATIRDLEEAIGAQTAAVFVAAHLENASIGLTLEQIAQVAKPKGVAIIVDAAYMNFPLVPDPAQANFSGVPQSVMSSFHTRGGDLVCFSAKYFWGPNAAGLICGRRDLIDIVTGLDFTRFESGPHKPFGRVFKMGRFEVAATALALEAWLTMDHGARLRNYRRQVDRVAEALRGVVGITCQPAYFTMDERYVFDGPVNCLVVDFHGDSPKAIKQIQAFLYAQRPRILPYIENDRLTIVMESVRDGEERVIADALVMAFRAPA